MSRTWKFLLTAAGILGLFIAWRFFPVHEWVRDFLSWVEALGFWGPLVVGAAYVVSTILFIPGSALTAGSGLAFGLLVGTLTVVAASNIGACLAFWIGRTAGRGWIEERVQDNEKFRAVDRAVGERGFKIVLLTRLSPLFPFNLLNYAYGLTRVRFLPYVLGSFLGMLPGTVMYVYIGTGLRSLALLASGGEREKSVLEYGMLGVGLVVTVAVTVYVTLVARRAIREKVDLPDSEKETDGNEEGSSGAPAEGSAQSEA